MLAVSVFVTRWFDGWARKQGISDRSLCAAIDEMERGLTDANLGGNLYKKRLAARGRGKSGSYRTLVAFKSGEVSFFVYGFAKTEKDDIDAAEKRALKAFAKELFGYDERRITMALGAMQLRQLRCDDEQEQT